MNAKINVSELTPYPRRNAVEGRKTVYAIFDYDKIEPYSDPDPTECFFEDDFELLKARLSELNNVRLYMAYLKVVDKCAQMVWEANKEYIDANHGNSMHWSPKYKSWQF